MSFGGTGIRDIANHCSASGYTPSNTGGVHKSGIWRGGGVAGKIPEVSLLNTIDVSGSFIAVSDSDSHS